jgi:cell wall-associated protease
LLIKSFLFFVLVDNKIEQIIMKFIYSLIFFLFLFISCKITNESAKFNVENKNKIFENDPQFWHQKDLKKDGIPGISLDKFYNENKKKLKLKSIIVAVIDTQIDINHEDLQDQIWTNPKEIPNNNIDDDHNGYIDDVNGWNFVGTKSGNYIVWGNFEYVRFVRTWDTIFKNKKEVEILPQDMANYKEYLRAIKMLEKNTKFNKNYLKSMKTMVKVYPLAKDTLKYYFPKEDYTIQQLDSMYKIYKINDKTFNQMRDDGDRDFGALIYFMMLEMKLNMNSIDKIQDKETQLDSIVNKNLNVNYDERFYIGDDPKVLEKGYGTNKICSNIKGIRSFQDHNTKVSGIIAANRENNIGIKGFSNNIKIMPLVTSFSGDEHDKDIAMAIRYAVDNGAKVINMSFGKEFSLHKEWVHEAFKYAEAHDVLLVHSSGNSGFNGDENPIYPNDIAFDGTGEVCNNFINVGSISQKTDSALASNLSNYGKNNVDILAPGDDIYTSLAGNKYEYDSGTSFAAPMVSGTAALIWLYYPKLTAPQVKQIILDSGVSYDIEVIVPGTKDKKLKFSELSKSGKVVNVYNAMMMASRIRN